VNVGVPGDEGGRLIFPESVSHNFPSALVFIGKKDFFGLVYVGLLVDDGGRNRFTDQIFADDAGATGDPQNDIYP
jgi:hypothetical protein